MSQNKYEDIIGQIFSLEMVTNLTDEDALGAVVRGHLHLEELVNVMLALRVVDTSFLKKLELSYGNKIDLLCALGLKKSLAAPLKAIGRLRNRFAHDLDTKMQPDTIDNLFDTFDSFEQKVLRIVEERGIMDDILGKSDVRSRFALWITFLHSMLFIEKVRLDLGEW